MRLASSIAFALACFATSGHAASTVPVESAVATADSFAAKYERQQRERFDLLRNDSSPRVQVLAGRIYLDSDDPATKLLPKREDVVSRAVRLAPDDALVQWVAADQGDYSSSACGPTTRPDAEVANLVRLEPDNAAAWQYAVALAGANGNAAGVDDALAHMSAASQARDHQAEVAKIWTRLYADHPETLRQTYGYEMDDDPDADAPARPSAATLAFLDGLQQAERYSGTIDKALESACKPDAASNATWQRAGWCARAGELLATRGNSFGLRDTGLKMLAAAGATPDDLADLKRNQQWLIENAAVPMRNMQLFGELDTVVADWNGAADEIAATQNRLKRLGKPLTPPTGWAARADTEKAEENAAENTWTNYLDSVLDDLRTSADVRERALGFSMQEWSGTIDAEPEKTQTPSKAADSDTSLADLAAANRDNAFVQWIAATHDSGNDEAVSALRRLEPDNAAAWVMPLKSESNSVETLHRAAEASLFDDRSSQQVALLYAVFKRHPQPAEMRAPWANMEKDSDIADPAATGAYSLALWFAMANLRAAPMSNAWARCKTTNAEAADCIKLGRLMLHSDTTMITAVFGTAILRKLEALAGSDRDYARRIAWLQDNVSAVKTGADRYIEDYFSTGSEIEALRRAMTRAGKAEPPADWQPAQWKTDAPKATAASK